MYLGAAHVNLGNRNSTIKLFEFVQENSFGNKAYSQVDDYLKKLREQ